MAAFLKTAAIFVASEMCDGHNLPWGILYPSRGLHIPQLASFSPAPDSENIVRSPSHQSSIPSIQQPSGGGRGTCGVGEVRVEWKGRERKEK